MKQLNINSSGEFLSDGKVVKPTPLGQPVSVSLVDVPDREAGFEISRQVESKKVPGANCYVLGKAHTDYVTESPMQAYPVQFYRI